MLRILGGPKRLCDGITRRDLLQVGSLGLLGLGLREWPLPTPAKAADALPSSSLPGFGQAKSCILLFMYGSPSQLETFDPKPEAPVEIRGEFGCIPSSVPGLNVCERLPRLSQVMDKVTLIRSVSHPYPIHGVAFATTGIPRIDVADGAEPARPQPLAVHRLGGRLRRWAPPAEDRDPALAGAAQPGAALGVQQPARRRGAPGRALWRFPRARRTTRSRTEFVGQGHEGARKTLAGKVWEDLEPYRGITPESRFQLGAVVEPRARADPRPARPPPDAARADRAGAPRGRCRGVPIVGHRPPSRDGLRPARLAERSRQAFDLGQEPDETRDLYGMTLFGQASLTARRLVEAGGRFITVFWDEYGLAGTGWDTHWDHFPRMKDELLPGLDRTLLGAADRPRPPRAARRDAGRPA